MIRFCVLSAVLCLQGCASFYKMNDTYYVFLGEGEKVCVTSNYRLSVDLRPGDARIQAEPMKLRSSIFEDKWGE